MNLAKTVLLALLFSSSLAISQTRTYTAQLNKKVRDSLKQEESHAFNITVDSANFVYGQVEQETVDVVVTVFDPAHKKVQQFDGPGRGPERFMFTTDQKGEYQVFVAPFEEEQGKYTFELKALEAVAATPEGKADQLLMPFSGKEVPGAAVLVMKDGKVIFEKAYGMANLTYDVPFTTSTVTNIGSTSKQFTAMAIELLAQQGKLDLDDDIRKYFPELPDFGKKVSIRNLLTHTSGYREFLNLLAMTGRDLSGKLDREKVFEVIERQPELQNDPGAEWNYNNTGYVLLAALVEKVADTPFPQWMKENIFEPLNMDHTVVRANPNQVVPNRSMGYTFSNAGAYEEAVDLGGANGAGGIYTTVEDLAKWIRNFSDPKVGNRQIIKEMTTPYVLSTGDTTNYGLGLEIKELNGLKNINHGGADVAHRSMLMYFPEINGGVVVESNNASFDQSVPNKIATAFFKESMEIEKDKAPEKNAEEPEDFNYNPEDFEVYTGRYELEEAPGFVLTFKRDGDRIYTQATGQPEVDLKPVSDTVFSLVGVDAKISFHPGPNGRAKTLTLHQHGDHPAKRIDWEPSKEDLMEYTGKYFSDEIETMYTVTLKDSSLVMKNYQMPALKMTPGEKDSFSVEFPLANVEFQRNSTGTITGFKASNGRTRGVIFRKEE
ncbi:MAG: serine hydrolase [Salinimicrobium sp.]